MRCGGCAATRTAATQRTFSPNAGDPGNNEAVWPSSPIPRSCTSNAGGSDPKNFRSSVSYARAHSSGEDKFVGIGCTFSAGMGT